MLFDLIKLAFHAIASSPEYQNEYGTTCMTEKGEKVKSISEKRIADYLYENNIEYEYERPAFTRGWLFHDKIANPDFYLPEYEVYIEYWGLVNARTACVRAEYTRIMKWKMAQYHENRIKFISIYPNNMDNLDWVFKAKMKNVLGRELTPSRLSNKTQHVMDRSNKTIDVEVIKQLGNHHQKLLIMRDEDGISLRPKIWMGKAVWSDINEILSAKGFRWLSNGRESCWRKD